MNTTRNKTTEARSPRGSRLDYFRTLGGLFAVSDVRCQATGAKRSPVNMDSYLYVSCLHTPRVQQSVRLLFFTRSPWSYHFPTVPVRPASGKVCYVFTPWLTFVVVMTMSHNAWWPAPCESVCFDPLYGDALSTQNDASREYANWFGAAQNHLGVKATRDVGLISFFCFCWLLSTTTTVVCRRQCSYIILVITGIALSKPSCP